MEAIVLFFFFFLLCLSTDIEPVSGIIDEACSIRSRGGDHMKYVWEEFPCCNSRAQSTGKQVELN